MGALVLHPDSPCLVLGWNHRPIYDDFDVKVSSGGENSIGTERLGSTHGFPEDSLQVFFLVLQFFYPQTIYYMIRKEVMEVHVLALHIYEIRCAWCHEYDPDFKSSLRLGALIGNGRLVHWILADPENVEQAETSETTSVWHRPDSSHLIKLRV